VAKDARFCSRCGARVSQPRPAAVRKYALSRIFPSWWHFARELVVAAILLGGGLYLLAAPHGGSAGGFGLIAGSVLVFALATLARRYTSWSLTSDRLIERRGMLASHRREMELTDIRSIEVDRTLVQRIAGLGSVTVASAASAEFLIRMTAIPDPDKIAETVRQARLKRLA
jgi:uncharacterized membrane protein YdbT with pleckstrin-like domain